MTTNGTLFDSEFQIKQEMLETIQLSFKDKYRLFLFTQVPSEKSDEYARAKELITK